MKKILQFLISFMVWCFFYGKIHGQVTVLKSPQEHQEDVDLPYDSLTNISKKNFRSQVGQTLYLLESDYCKKEGYWAYNTFYREPLYKKNIQTIQIWYRICSSGE